MLYKSFFNIFCFSDVYRIRAIIFLTKQEIYSCLCNILTITRRNLNTRNLNCFSIPI